MLIAVGVGIMGMMCLVVIAYGRQVGFGAHDGLARAMAPAPSSVVAMVVLAVFCLTLLAWVTWMLRCLVFSRARELAAFVRERDGGLYDERRWRKPLYDELGDLATAVNRMLDAMAAERAGSQAAARALKERERRYRELIEKQGEAVCRWRPDTTLTVANENYCRIFGMTEAEMLGRRWIDLVPERQRESVGRQIEYVLAHPNTLSTYEVEVVGAGGDACWMEWIDSLLPGDDGQSVEVQSVGRDVTERKRLERERLLLSAAAAQVGAPVFITRTNGDLEYVNTAFERLTGFDRAAALGRPPAFLASGKHVPGFYRKMWRTLLRGNVWEGMITVRCRDDSLREFQTIISPIRDEHGCLCNFVGAALDMTLAHQLEKQLRQVHRMEAIGTLAGGIAHDFNNMLFAIMGFASMAQNHVEKGSRAHEDLEHVMTASRRAADLVRQVLLFSRQHERQTMALSLSPILKESVRLLRATMPTTISLQLQIVARSDTVVSDPSQIQQVIMNLGINAFHAMRDKGGALSMRLDNPVIAEDVEQAPPHDKRGTGWVRLAVRDTGCGIPPAHLNRVFDPFFTTKPVGEGTGLGLAVVHSIVSGMGGFIRVESEPNAGSTFLVHLPLADSVSVPIPLRPAVLASGHERILCVDDELMLVCMTREILESLGYQVTTFTNSGRALSAFCQQPEAFDLLLTDQTMPHLTGVQLAEEIRRRHPSLPIMIMTGYGSSHLSAERIAALNAKVLLKPLDRESLGIAVRSALDASRKAASPVTSAGA